VAAGLSAEQARRRCWFFDTKGLVVQDRTHLADHKIPYAHPHPRMETLQDSIQALRPTGILGVSGTPGSFTRPILEKMSTLNERPIVFALSNPTSKAECTAEEAYVWSQGRAIFASGSPFDPVVINGDTLIPGQGNNAYIFPGVGLGVVLSQARHVTDEMFMASAKTLADAVGPNELERGQLYPPIDTIRSVSAAIAAAVFQVADARSLARKPLPDNLPDYIRRKMYVPKYKHYA